MKTMYCANPKFGTIVAIEVERETDVSVWINGRRHSKISEWNCYYDTFKEAKIRCMAVATEFVEKAQRQLDDRNALLTKAVGLTEL